MKIWLAVVCLLVAGCDSKTTQQAREAAYVKDLQERRFINDLDRKIIGQRCGEVIDLWQASIAADAAHGNDVSRFAENLRASPGWAEFHKKRELQNERMRSLVDPPERYRVQYEKVLRQFGHVARLLSLLERPTGSLVSYTAEVRSLASDYDQLAAELEVSLPSIPLNPISMPPT